MIEGNDGDSAIKLSAGSAVVYPTTSLHRVAPVTAGERLVVVGWVRSLIRRADQREVLFDLDEAVAEMRQQASRGAGLDAYSEDQGQSPALVGRGLRRTLPFGLAIV